MKLDNFYVVEHKEGAESVRKICYYEPGADINSTEFKKEFGYPEGVTLRKIPQAGWSVAKIRNIMGAFFDERCKVSSHYAPSTFEAAIDGLGLDKEGKQKAMLGILRTIEHQFVNIMTHWVFLSPLHNKS